MSRGTRLPAETVCSFRTTRVLSAPIPTAFGGLGADLLSTANGIRRIARKAPSTALALSMPLGNAANARIPDEPAPTVARAAFTSWRARRRA